VNNATPVQCCRAWLAAIASLLIVLSTATAAFAQAQTQPSQGLTLDPEANAAPLSPNAIQSRIDQAQASPAGLFPYSPVSVIDPLWRDVNRQTQKVGLTLGLNYTMVYQAASNGPGVRDAAGGSIDLFGDWQLLGKKNDPSSGRLYFEVEDRHAVITPIPPASLSGQIGSLWKTTDGFQEEAFTMREFYWEQHIGGNFLIARIGKLDAEQYYGSNYWASDRLYFLNQAFSGTPAIAIPSKGLGANLTLRPSDLWFVSVGTQDAEGKATTGGFNTLFEDFNLFSAVDLGFTPTIPGLGKGTYRFTGWYRDDGKSQGTPHDAGFGCSFDQHVGPNLIPFFKCGFNQGNDCKVEDMIAAGIGWQGKLLSPSDVIGLAGSWGRPSDHDLRDQYAAEAFYRMQVARDIQLTVGYQAIFDPSKAPGDDVVGVFEFRWGISF